MATAVFPTSRFEYPSGTTPDDRHGWGLALLMTVVATLFVRPADLVPALDGWPIYQYLILACVVVAMRSAVHQLCVQSIQQKPLTASLIVLLFSVGMSHLAHGFLWAARMSIYEVSKLIILYLLIVGLVNTPKRLFLFVKSLSLIITCIAGLSLLDRFDIWSIAALESIRDHAHPDSVANFVYRLRGTGIFQDPNDFGMILVTGVILCASSFMAPGVGWLRHFWLIPIFVITGTLALTHSRGAFLSLASVVPAAVAYRMGWKYGLFSLVSLPALAVVFSARMTDVSSITVGTGQSRIQIWSDSLMIWRNNPLFGLGEGMLVDELGVVTHNSFLQCFAELGLLGGTAFVACFLAALLGLWSVRHQFWQAGESHSDARELHRLSHLRMFVFAAVAAYALGILTLSRQFVAPTYLLLGLAAAAQWVSPAARPELRTNTMFVLLSLACSVCLLLFCHFIVRILIYW